MGQIENKHENAVRNLPISIMALNEIGLDALYKRQRLPNWIKSKIKLCTVYRRHTYVHWHKDIQNKKIEYGRPGGSGG